jgi:hypothetical protein
MGPDWCHYGTACDELVRKEWGYMTGRNIPDRGEVTFGMGGRLQLLVNDSFTVR